jgi:hypothetical protein
MQRTVSVAAVALLSSVALIGCGESKQDQAGGGAAGLVSVELRASLPGAEPGQTRGGYGFTVNELGAYRVGPGPAGETIEGFVTPTELGGLMAAVNGTSTASTPAPAAGEGEEATGGGETGEAPAEPVAAELELPAGEETVTITRGGATVSQINATSAGLNAGSSSRTQAESVHRTIRELATRYYPDQFPGECATAAAAIQALAPSVKSCTQDTECGYVHWDFTPAEGEQLVNTDISRWWSPLVAANLSAVEANYDQLVAAFNLAETACEPRSNGSRSHILTSQPAVCDAGVCKANPALSY